LGFKASQSKKFSKTPSQLIMGMVAYACHLSYAVNINRKIVVQTGLDKNSRSYPKINQSTRTRGMAQVVECLPSKHKALRSTPMPQKEEM
jgi:hypothetical protein